MAKIAIQNSASKGQRILIIEPDPMNAQKLEASFEQNPELSGINVYVASTLEEGRDIARQHSVHLVIFPDGLEGGDFVSTQQELRNACKTIELIPLISVPSVAQLRESNRIGGVIDFADKSVLQDKTHILNLILSYFREKQQNYRQHDVFRFAATIQKALLIDHAEWDEIKGVSAEIINVAIGKYDVGTDESVQILAAEMVYMPWIGRDQYSTLLGVDTYQLLDNLISTASWLKPGGQPRSVGGFVITISNFIALRVVANDSKETIYGQIKLRPSFLQHPALRVISESALESIIEKTGAFKRQAEVQ